MITNIQPYIEDAEKSEEVLSDKFDEINVLAQEAIQMSDSHIATHDNIKFQLETAIFEGGRDASLCQVVINLS